MDLLDIIYQNNNYVESLQATGNNEKKNMIFIQHFYILKQQWNIQSYKEEKR